MGNRNFFFDKKLVFFANYKIFSLFGPFCFFSDSFLSKNTTSSTFGKQKLCIHLYGQSAKVEGAGFLVKICKVEFEGSLSSAFVWTN